VVRRLVLEVLLLGVLLLGVFGVLVLLVGIGLLLGSGETSGLEEEDRSPPDPEQKT
jgi:hypothetical protein